MASRFDESELVTGTTSGGSWAADAICLAADKFMAL